MVNLDKARSITEAAERKAEEIGQPSSPTFATSSSR
jgi:hypothetical protein